MYSMHIQVYTLLLGKVLLKCPQNGKVFTQTVSKVSLESGEPITRENLQPGSEVIVLYEGRPYPVEVVQLEGLSLLSLFSSSKGLSTSN